jgi:biopolymer transport protein ExbD
VGGTADAAPNLPRWSRPRPAAPAGVHVAIGPDGLRVDGTLLAPLPPKELRSHGFDASYKSKPNSLVLVPLVAALDAPHSPDAVLDVDPETSYRVLTEVFFTLAQHGVSGFHFLVEYDTSSGPAVGSVDVYAPARGPNGLPEGNPTAPLVVRLRPDGLLLRGSGKNIPAECGDTTRIDAQLTYDFAAVTRCGAALKKPDKLTDDLLLVASPEVPFRLVVATMDALAQDYPHVNFGIMR